MLTARPEFRSPWTMVAYLTALTLRRFAPAQVTRLASHVAGDRHVNPAVLEEVVRKTDGVPLFVEELTKAVLELGLLQEQEDGSSLAGPLPPLGDFSHPARCADGATGSPGSGETGGELGAVIGRTFTVNLVQAVASLERGDAARVLAQLVEAELVAQRGMPPQAVYTFKQRAVPRRGVPVATTEYAAAVPSPDCSGIGGAVS